MMGVGGGEERDELKGEGRGKEKRRKEKPNDDAWGRREERRGDDR